MRSCFITAVRAAIRAAFFVLALEVSLLTAPPAYAQTACADRDEIVSVLESQYGERPAAVGVAGERALVEIFAAPDGATWTILLTNVDGISCAVLAGEVWRSIPVPNGDQT